MHDFRPMMAPHALSVGLAVLLLGVFYVSFFIGQRGSKLPPGILAKEKKKKTSSLVTH